MPKKFLVVFFLLYAFANFFNLGKPDFNYKEAKNAIISLQLNKSGNYKWQTILGKPYFKKPPLAAYYTSILFKIFGDSEFVSRAGQFVFVILIAFLPFLLKGDFLNIDALYFAFVFLTTAIVLLSINFYSVYAMGVFFLFLALYNVYFKHKNFAIWLAFAFLTLGLSAIFLFYAILLGFVVCEKKPELIESKEHIVGILSIGLLSLVGIAMYNFSIKSIHYLAGSLFLGFLESFDFKNYLLHLVFFPFEIFLMLLPWTIFAKQLVKKQPTPLYRFAFYGTMITLCILWVLPFENYLILVPFFALLVSFYKVELPNIYIKTIALICVLLILNAGVFGYLFVKSSNYILLLLFIVFVVFFISILSRRYKLEQYIYIAVLLICLKATYSMVYIPYEVSYLPDMNAYGQKIASIILKNKAKYVMSNNVHLNLLYYIEKESNLPINIPQRNKGVLITQNRDLLKKVYGFEFSPYGVFFVGEY